MSGSKPKPLERIRKSSFVKVRFMIGNDSLLVAQGWELPTSWALILNPQLAGDVAGTAQVWLREGSLVSSSTTRIGLAAGGIVTALLPAP